MTTTLTPSNSWDDPLTPEVDDNVSASNMAAVLQTYANRTQVLVPDVQEYTANSNWTKDSNAVCCEFFLVPGGGNGGTAGGSGDGGAGGGARGGVKRRTLPASMVPSNLTVSVGGPGAISSVASGDFAIYTTPGAAGSSPSGGTGGAGGTAPTDGDYPGGAGGAGGDTSNGGSSGSVGLCAAGGAGGGAASPRYGNGGLGYGAGGGGGTVDLGVSGGGGGGASGYGIAALATDAGAGYPGTGAPGLVVITTWRGGS